MHPRKPTMRSAHASELLRTILTAHPAAYGEDDHGVRYRAQRLSDVEIRMRRYVKHDGDEEDRVEEIDHEPDGVEWRPA